MSVRRAPRFGPCQRGKHCWGKPMNEPLTSAEIKAQFNHEWILIKDPVTNELLEVQGGNVLFHSKDRDEFDWRMLEFNPKRSAVVFTGKPKNMEFVL